MNPQTRQLLDLKTQNSHLLDEVERLRRERDELKAELVEIRRQLVSMRGF